MIRFKQKNANLALSPNKTINYVWYQPDPTQFTGLLDTYGGASAAYSLRKLRKLYTGNLIRVRRSSDNTEQNIGIVNNQLDTASLLSFCSGTNGFVTTWYDQSGNANDAVQASSTAQPQIVNGGNLITVGGNVTLQFDGVNDDFYTPVGTSAVTDLYFVINTSDQQYLFPQKSGNVYGFVAQIGNASSPYSNYGAPSLYTNGVLRSSSTRGQVYTAQNGYNVVVHQNANTSAWTGGYNLFNYGGYEFGGDVQEIIIYLSDQSTNRSGIETNMNDYYSIY